MDQSVVDSFTGITGASADQAQFYLESANGDLEVRLALALRTRLLTMNRAELYTHKCRLPCQPTLNREPEPLEARPRPQRRTMTTPTSTWHKVQAPDLDLQRHETNKLS